MKLYTVFNVESGTISARMMMTDVSLPPPLMPGEDFIEGFFDPLRFMVKDRKPVPKEDGTEGTK